MHSFAITERYAIIVAGPFIVRPMELALSGRPLIENFRWKPDRATKIYVLDRHKRRQGRHAGRRPPVLLSPHQRLRARIRDRHGFDRL